MSNSTFAQTKLSRSEVSILKSYLKKNIESVIHKIDQYVNWDQIANDVRNDLNISGEDKIEFDLNVIIKCFILESILSVTDDELTYQLGSNANYRSFIHSSSNTIKIPSSIILSAYRDILIHNGVYKKIFDDFYSQLTDSEFVRADKIVSKEPIQKKSLIPKYKPAQSLTPTRKKSEPLFDLRKKTKSIDDLFQKPLEISDAFIEILRSTDRQADSSSIIGKNLIKRKTKDEVSDLWLDELDKILTNSNGLDEAIRIGDKEYFEIENSLNEISEPVAEVKSDKKSQLEEKIKEIELKLTEVLQRNQTSKISQEESEKKKLEIEKKKRLLQKLQEIDEKLRTITEKRKSVTVQPQAEDKVTETEFANDEFTGNVIQPNDMEEVELFNESNLTEDYELGLRFHKMGLKSSFINLREDITNRDSMIATAEYFPNKMWPSIKQRSRWIAGISFQNWKLHKWEGSLKTKYFLMRDRKTIFSNLFVLLSNVVFAYFIFYMIDLAMGWNIATPLVHKYSILWYLLVMSFVFMVNRLFHRFLFTYKWYGLKYAFFSVGRLIVDNFINFFATIRAIKVFKQTKHKVVWDKTDHY